MVGRTQQRELMTTGWMVERTRREVMTIGRMVGRTRQKEFLTIRRMVGRTRREFMTIRGMVGMTRRGTGYVINTGGH